MKKFRLGKIMAVFAFIAMLPLQSFAAEAEETEVIEEVSVTCTPKDEENKEYEVYLHIPNASEEQIATVSLKLDVTPDPKKSATGYSSMIKFSADVAGSDDGKIPAKAKVYEYRSGNTLNIYIAGTKALFEKDTLFVGTVSMRNSANEALALEETNGVKLSNTENSLLVVRGFGGAESPNRDTSWKQDGTEEKPPEGEIPPEPGTDGEEDPEEPNEPGVPGGSENPGSNTAKDQYDNNRKVNGSRTQGVKTGDTNGMLIYVFSAVACVGVVSAVAYRKRKVR